MCRSASSPLAVHSSWPSSERHSSGSSTSRSRYLEQIEASLAESPIPTGSEGESAEEIFACFGVAFQANFQATLAIARDLDEWLEEETRQEEEADEE